MGLVVTSPQTSHLNSCRVVMRSVPYILRWSPFTSRSRIVADLASAPSTRPLAPSSRHHAGGRHDPSSKARPLEKRAVHCTIWQFLLTSLDRLYRHEVMPTIWGMHGSLLRNRSGETWHRREN